jgi:hypothetical protein
VSIRKLPDGKKLARLLGDRVDVQGGLKNPKHEMNRGFPLDVVVLERPTIFKHLAGEDEPLLVRRDTFPILDMLPDVFDGITRLDLDRDRLPRERFHEDLHRRDGGGASERTGEEDEA